MGGEWASGAALVSETWPAEHRGKALGIVQSSWAVGYAAAAIVTQLVLPVWGWRAVFFVGILPALVTAWVRRSVEEPEVWQKARAAAPGRSATGRLAEIFRGPMLRLTVFVTLMNACTLYAYWAFTQWVPAYLELSPARGGLGLGSYKTLLVVAMNVGMWFGYVTFGLVSDRLGRKRTYVTYVLAAAFFVMAYASVTHAAGAARARAVRRVLRGGLLQRVRRGHRGDLPDQHPRHRAGIHLQPGADRQRGRAVDGRDARRLARLPDGVRDRRGRVRPRRRRVDLDPGDPGKGYRIASVSVVTSVVGGS